MKRWNASSVALLFVLGISFGAWAQQDPGPRPGPAGAGSFYPTLNTAEQAAFANGISQFIEDEPVPDVPQGNGGLGPGFNSTSCGSCHSHPATLGTSPSPSSPQVPQTNPQIAAAMEMGAKNTIPSFITPNGPVREARFIRNPDGTLDGGVHDLFSIAGRTDAPGCNLQQPDFAAQLAANNVIFRIPTPLFGLGLVENTPDSVLKQNLAGTAAQRQALGIGGTFNLSGNDGTIMKFGWKAQNKSLTIFAGEAYNVEMGISNDVMSNERNAISGCVFNPTPEDSHSQVGGSDVDAFVDAIRLSAPAIPIPPTPSTSNGSKLFASVGCALCHSPSLTTAASPNTGMGGVTYNPFSDFALHHMGPGLADGINQGAAGPDQFRTAPLWGVGQRLFFLHDGRTSDLLQAIKDHSSDDCRGQYDHRSDQRNCGSEADGVIRNFKTLSPSQVQDLLNFLRSL
ncbi:MAG TPA: di-heme oxidoredictase family protein [Terriglobales bacterium]|nr:di-heme oxidoredictase family protein [Terriglobales bacterium]